ncbi:TPA: hypothetical protein VGT17_005219 [Vibrio harveyi]|nr:hypothetical protein [Vibrio harveyi]HEQ3599251.1 hypothetical protein [Vibrio harveyi]HEQ3611309.1 hypothetical protein [Vibrio harveyi]
MAILSLPKSYNPSLSWEDAQGEEVVAELDAEFDMSLLMRVRSTTYPVEQGFEVAGSLVLIPTEIVFTWGIGVEKVAPLLSEDFADNLQANAAGMMGGLVSNLIDSNMLNFLIGALADSSIFQTDKDSRAFKALSLMQSAMLTGTYINPVIDGIGKLNNMLISSLRATRGGKAGGLVMFKITMSQQLQVTAANESEKVQDLGEITAEEVDDEESENEEV